MKKTTYECKKCGQSCNGGALSFAVVESKDMISFVISRDLDQLPEHACGEEHLVQALALTVRRIEGAVNPERIAGKLEEGSHE